MIFKNDLGDYHFFREVGRAPLEELVINGDELEVVWDQRVQLRFPSGRAEPLLVRALSLDEGKLVMSHYKNQAHYKNLSNQNSLSSSLPALDVLLGLATIWTVGENSVLLAVPQLEAEFEHEVFKAINEGSGAVVVTKAGSLKIDVGLPLKPPPAPCAPVAFE